MSILENIQSVELLGRNVDNSNGENLQIKQ